MQQGSNPGSGAAWMLLAALGGFAFAGVVFCAEMARFGPEMAWEIRFMIRSGKGEPQSGQTYGQTNLRSERYRVGKEKVIRPLKANV